MGIVDEHIAQLNSVADAERRFSKAVATPAPNGTTLVKLCDFVLPTGWLPTRTNVYFLVPAGYPTARPDTFWTEIDVHLASAAAGARPANTGDNQPPGIPPGLRWFSWHPAAWKANRDNLVNYVAFIRRRFEDKR